MPKTLTREQAEVFFGFSIGPGVESVTILDTLDSAWGEVTAALPDGYAIAALDCLLPLDRQRFRSGWSAEASLIIQERWSGDSIYGEGDTPIEALLDLAVKLRAR